jgi:O-antigen/teichoic acid export membrane protein
MNFGFGGFIKSKFASDSLWSIASVIFLGVCGLLLNFIIARRYNAQVLGIFNLSYAVYIISSQFATLGVQVSAQKHIAESPEDEVRCRSVIASGLLVVVLLASFCTVVLYLIRGWLAMVLKSPGVAVGILYIIPGLWCFSINKFFLNVLNGFRRMRSYSMLVSLRYLAILMALLYAAAIGLPGEKISGIFSVAEFLLLFVLLVVIYRLRLLSFTRVNDMRSWVKKHVVFGTKSFMGGVTAELNTRIDVLIIGYFWSDWHVGIYSFAAVIVEGVNQIPYVLKQNIDPVFARLIAERKFDTVREIISYGRRWSFYAMALLGLTLILVFPVVTNFIVKNQEFRLAWPVFFILMVGAIIQNSTLPFSGILVQAGYPGLQTALIVSAALSNIALNLAMVPVFGINGAAVATSLSFVLFVVYLRILTTKALNVAV